MRHTPSAAAYPGLRRRWKPACALCDPATAVPTRAATIAPFILALLLDVVDYRSSVCCVVGNERATIIRVRERRAKRVTVAQRPGEFGRARLSTYRSLVQRSATRGDELVLCALWRLGVRCVVN